MISEMTLISHSTFSIFLVFELITTTMLAKVMKFSIFNFIEGILVGSYYLSNTFKGILKENPYFNIGYFLRRDLLPVLTY